jgi:hypothetical protein
VVGVVVVAAVVVVVVVLAVVACALVVAATVVVVLATLAVTLRESTGSCPLASVIVISSQLATNSATAPATIRRRSRRARRTRAAFSRAPDLSMTSSLPVSRTERVRIG